MKESLWSLNSFPPKTGRSVFFFQCYNHFCLCSFSLPPPSHFLSLFLPPLSLSTSLPLPLPLTSYFLPLSPFFLSSSVTRSLSSFSPFLSFSLFSLCDLVFYFLSFRLHFFSPLPHPPPPSLNHFFSPSREKFESQQPKQQYA